MKRTATLILNRNLPSVTDSLVEQIQQQDGDRTDVYVIESGSSRENLSKHCSWWANWDDAIEHGLRYPRGFNFGLWNLLKEGLYEKYDFFFLICNDAEFEKKPILSKLEEEMNLHPRVGILSPCSEEWGEYKLLGQGETKYFWYINSTAWLVRREYLDSIRELEDPGFMNFVYDGTNFRGYGSEIELIMKGYLNDWASAITSKVTARENQSYLITKADLIKTEPFEQSLLLCVEEGKKWMRRKYGFNSRWNMQMVTKFLYDKFFEYNPDLEKFRI